MIDPKCVRIDCKTAIARVVSLMAGVACMAATAGDAFQTKSEIKGVSVVSLSSQHRSPESGMLDDYCADYRATKLTVLGKQVESQGWVVTSEAPLGRYRVVSFASGFDEGTSSMCFARNANIAVFDDDRLVALVYTSHKSDRRLLEWLSATGKRSAVWSGDGPSAPVAELHADQSGVRLTAIAPQRTVCHGRAVVPNIYSITLDAARKALLTHGWRPMRPEQAPDDDDLAAN